MLGRQKAQFSILLCAVLAATAGCSHKGPKPTRHIPVTMKKFSILPGEITAKQGESVVLEVTTADVQHGFAVEDLGINEPVQPGRVTAIPLDTSRSGRFKVTCSIICGSGHDDMNAEIVIH